MKTPITVEALINAPVEKVWEYWTDPQYITKWCNASPDWHAPHAANDMVIGGKFLTRMEAKDGSVGFDFEGVYSAVSPYKNIEYAMADGRKVKITFGKIDGSSCQVIETFDPEDINSIEIQKGGWQSILNNFKKYTEEN